MTLGRALDIGAGTIRPDPLFTAKRVNLSVPFDVTSVAEPDMSLLVECVPNFSEGRDSAVIRGITTEIEAVRDVTLLDVDPGEDTNRTVITFVGPPEAVVEAAFRAGKRAAETIDMTKRHGQPRSPS